MQLGRVEQLREEMRQRLARKWNAASKHVFSSLSLHTRFQAEELKALQEGFLQIYKDTGTGANTMSRCHTHIVLVEQASRCSSSRAL